MDARAVIVGLVMASACGFEGQANKLPVGDGGTTDAFEPPIVCGDIVCDPHAVCTTTGGASCTCGPGYEGDGLSCHDVDECLAPATDCNIDGEPGTLCQNTPGSHLCYTLSTCEESKAHGYQDGNVELHIDDDLRKPWTAYCKGDDEYLTLIEQGNDRNFGQYTHERAGESDVKTRYQRIRIDPVTLIVDINDRTFSSSTGELRHGALPIGPKVTSMPYGVAMDCNDGDGGPGVGGGGGGGNPPISGRANIDLSGLPFKVASDFAKGGNQSDGTAQKSNGDRTVAITGGGHCGWYSPTPPPNNPFNNFTGNSKILQLTYSPLLQ